MESDLASSIQAAKDVHYFSRFSERKQQLLDGSRENFERYRALFRSQLKIQQETINHKNMLARLKLAQQTLEQQTAARSEAWKSQRQELEKKKLGVIEAAKKLEEEERLRKVQADKLRQVLERDRRERAQREAL